MEKMLAKFSGNMISKEQMKSVQGGTYSNYKCTCGSGGGYAVGAETSTDATYFAAFYCDPNSSVSCNLDHYE